LEEERRNLNVRRRF